MRLEAELVERVEELTNTSFKKYYISDNEKQVLIVSEEVSNMFESLIDKIEGLQKEIDDINQDKEDNYQRIPVEDQYE